MTRCAYETSVHIPYTLSKKNKFTHYEQKWKIAALRLINRVYAREEDRKYIKILDFGCGRGELLKMLVDNNYSCCGMDFDDQCISISSRYAPCKKGDYKDLVKVYSKEAFDVVISLHTLEHMENPKECVEFLCEMSRKYLLFAIPNLANLSNLRLRRVGTISNRGHVCGWDYPHFDNFLTNYCGLKVVQWTFDVVRLPNLSGKVDRVLHLSGVREIIEEGC